MGINEQLRDELIQMMKEDLRVRTELLDAGELEQPTPRYHERMREVHHRNNTRMKAVIEESGWPGINLVEEDGAEAAWLIVQHAVLDPDFQRHCLQLLEQAAEAGMAEMWQVAYLKDRVLWSQGKEQVYGTHYEPGEDGEMVPCPTIAPEDVDERRRAVGLCPIEENTARIRQEHREAMQKHLERINRERSAEN